MNPATTAFVARRIAVADDQHASLLVNLNARIPKRLWRRVRLQCVRDERLLRGFVTEALQDYLRTRGRAGAN
jgi:hypothetical protein